MDRGPAIRAAEPTAEDGRTYAAYADRAADGLYRWMLGPTFVEILARAFVIPGHDQSFEHVHIAEDDGDAVGMVSGFTAEAHARSNNDALTSAAGWRAPRLVSTWLLAYPALRFMDRVPDGDWYLQAVAVDSGRRGEGIGSSLLDHAESQARQSGAARLVLDVVGSNATARRLYESRGMVAESRTPRVPFRPTFALHRMVLPLQP